jgi:hypothetical protein
MSGLQECIVAGVADDAGVARIRFRGPEQAKRERRFAHACGEARRDFQRALPTGIERVSRARAMISGKRVSLRRYAARAT